MVPRWMLLWVALMVPWSARGDAVLFIQGYGGHPDHWRASGIIPALATVGWGDAGTLALAPAGVVRHGSGGAFRNAAYTVSLPTEAPLMVQLGWLERYLDTVRQNHSGERITLVGHSAGGVLGRLYMVTHPESGVGALITIASPHLGTEVAEMGILAAESPLGWIAPMLGLGTLNRSLGLYYDLAPERPGSVLFWLNRQPHPSATYVSIVRGAEPFGDAVVPSWSQDANLIPALRGSVETVVTPGDHRLSPADGAVVLGVLRRLEHP